MTLALPRNLPAWQRSHCHQTMFADLGRLPNATLNSWPSWSMTRRTINMLSYLYQYHWLSMDKCPISIVYGFIYLYTVAAKMQVSNCCLKVVKTMSSISSCVRKNLRGLWCHDVGSNCEVSLTWGQLIWDPWRHHVVFLFNVLSPWFFIVVVYIFRVLNSKRLQHDGFWHDFDGCSQEAFT